jgi:hypothetical protein
MVDRHGDCIGPHALTVVRASALFDPVLEFLETLKPPLELTLARRRGVGLPVRSSIRRPAAAPGADKPRARR